MVERIAVKDFSKKSPKIKTSRSGEGSFNYEFTCPRCGAHSFVMAQTSQSKYGGYELDPARVRVCRNCHYSDLLVD